MQISHLYTVVIIDVYSPYDIGTSKIIINRSMETPFRNSKFSPKIYVAYGRLCFKYQGIDGNFI